MPAIPRSTVSHAAALAAGAALLLGCGSESPAPRPVAWHKIPVPDEALVTIYARLARAAHGNATPPAEGPGVFFVELENDVLRKLQESLAGEGFIVRNLEGTGELQTDRSGNLVDPETGRRAAKLSVSASWMGEHRINAGAEFYVGGVWGSGLSRLD